MSEHKCYGYRIDTKSLDDGRKPAKKSYAVFSKWNFGRFFNHYYLRNEGEFDSKLEAEDMIKHLAQPTWHYDVYGEAKI